jgi:translation initiation factor 1
MSSDSAAQMAEQWDGLQANRGADNRTLRDYDPSVSNSRLVYSTDDGDRRKAQPKQKQASPARGGPQLPNDGIVRVFREKGGRGGKVVTVVRGLPSADAADVAKDLKRHCGSGGAAKDGVVEIQGDHREKVAARLEQQGYRVKLAGG